MKISKICRECKNLKECSEDEFFKTSDFEVTNECYAYEIEDKRIN